jgi:nucleoside-diphosphate-sugar epimerase
VFSFVHVADVATAVVAALDHDVYGVLNVVDDDPVPIRDWLPEMAEVLGAPRPRRMPLALVRLAAGGWGAAYLGALRGADNTRARHVLGWQPRHRSWQAAIGRELTAHSA